MPATCILLSLLHNYPPPPAHWEVMTQVYTALLTPVSPANTHAHVYTRTHICRLCCYWNDHISQRRVTCKMSHSRSRLFLHSNKHSLGVFTLRAPTPTIWPQKTCILACLFPQNGWILGFNVNRRKQGKKDIVCLRNKSNFLDFWDPYGKIVVPAASAALTVCHTDPALTKISSLMCVCLFALRAASLSVHSLEGYEHWCLHGPSRHNQSDNSWTAANIWPRGVGTDGNSRPITCALSVSAINRCLTFVCTVLLYELLHSSMQIVGFTLCTLLYSASDRQDFTGGSRLISHLHPLKLPDLSDDVI